MSYNPGTAVTGDWIFIETVTISDDATVDMDLSGSHAIYVFHLDNIIPATDTARLELRVSVDGGSTFLEGSADYRSQMSGAQADEGTIQYGLATTATTEAVISREAGNNGMGNATGESLNGFVFVHNAKQTTLDVLITTEMVYLRSEADFTPIGKLTGHKGRAALIDNHDEVDAVRFLASAGNLTSGRISLYGVDDA